ncbi:O-antigen polymerase [Alginatibacterium sediminis]|uniref:O-antigen polymerase n=1 Tax=Alginatibacterium sediminis TaxID=2164068 RepID=A0A420E7K5_9ALTE|nr:O-antigen polymerase [Alginatibacterium sediminis]
MAFVFLFAYSVAVLMRFHEFQQSTATLPIIQGITISAFIFTVLLIRPLKLTIQLKLLICMLPVIALSAYLNGWGTGGIYQARRLLISAILPFFLFSTVLVTRGRQTKLMYVCLIASMLIVYNGHLQQSSFNGEFGTGFGGSRSVGDEEMRITYLGFFSDPNDLGMFLVMNIPFAFYFLKYGSNLIRLLMLPTIALLAYGVLMTGSRGTLLGTIGVVSVYFLISKAGVKLIAFIAVIAPMAATLLASFGGLSSAESSANDRLEAWYEGVHMLLNNPVFGIGMGNFIEEHVRVAHNSYIHVASELGVLGYSLWGGVITLNMLASFWLIKGNGELRASIVDDEKRNKFDQELAINKTLFFSMIGFMITAFFLSRQFTLLLFIFLAMQTASFTRLSNIVPATMDFFSKDRLVVACAMSWIIIVTVYITLKIGL